MLMRLLFLSTRAHRRAFVVVDAVVAATAGGGAGGEAGGGAGWREMT